MKAVTYLHVFGGSSWELWHEGTMQQGRTAEEFKVAYEGLRCHTCCAPEMDALVVQTDFGTIFTDLIEEPASPVWGNGIVRTVRDGYVELDLLTPTFTEGDLHDVRTWLGEQR